MSLFIFPPIRYGRETSEKRLCQWIYSGWLSADHTAGRALDKLLVRISKTLDTALNIDVPESLLVQRLAGRRTCSNPDCQAIYNVAFKPPKVEGKCDVCGNPVVQRDDETEEAVKHRLKTYNEKTAPLIDYYSGKGLLKNPGATETEDIIVYLKKILK